MRARLVVSLAVALAAAACAPAPAPTVSPAASEGAAGPALRPGWHALPAAPLSARLGSTALWTGRELLVIGGSDSPPCPPNARCFAGPVFRTDGAAYDFAAGQWRPIADAPVPVGYAHGVVVDGTAWILAPAGPGLLAYDIAADTWRQVDPPKDGALGDRIAAAGSRLLIAHGSQEQRIAIDRFYDPATGGWEDIPRDPFAPAYDRALVWAGQALVAIGIPLARLELGGPPLYSAAVLDPATGEWRRLPDAEIVGWDPTWWWVDGRVVNGSIGSADGGEVNNWGRPFPFGGILDPLTGWLPLPDPPAQPGGFVEPAAAGAEHVVASGWVLHVPTGSWTALLEPPAGPVAETAETWAGDRLAIWGGVRWTGIQGELLDEGWVWLP